MWGSCKTQRVENGDDRAMAEPHSSIGDEQLNPLNDLVIVTHRGPVSLTRGDTGEIVRGQPAGGLAPSLTRALKGSKATWVAAATGLLEREIAGGDPDLEPDLNLRYVLLDDEVMHDAYQTIANETLWFLNHEMAEVAGVTIDERWIAAFDNFRIYNEAFARVITEVAPVNGTVMVNDYHLPLVGPILLRDRPDLKTLHFSHTPSCTPETLHILPDAIATELLTAMASYGVCGFHTDRWVDRFLACCESYGVRAPRVFSCGLGVDAVGLIAESSSPSVLEHVAINHERFDDYRMIFRSDRLEPTKNIVNGFLAYERLLEQHPELIESVVFHARSYLSRTDLVLYRDYRIEVEETVAKINERFGNNEYQPIVFEIDDDYDASLAAYRTYEVLIVNPLLDGMNLVVKEAAVVNKKQGAVILSRGAGAYEELMDCVIGIDPFDIDATAEAFESALSMPLGERAIRADRLSLLSAQRPPAVWLMECLTHLQDLA